MNTSYGQILHAMAVLGVKRGVQHRTEFLLEGGLSAVTIVIQLVPVAVLFEQRETIAGWSHGQVLVLLGWFLIVSGILQGVVIASFSQAIDGIRTGQFDYLLLKPADTLFLASVGNLRPWKFVDVAAGLLVVGFGLAETGRLPAAIDLLLGAALGATGLVTLYALYIFAVAGSFALVRIENLMDVLSGLFDFGRWPIHVFEGAWRVLFTVLLPLAVITSYPAMAILGTLSWREVVVGAAVAAGFVTAARIAWTVALARYGSASS